MTPEKNQYTTKAADRLVIFLELENLGAKEWPASGSSAVRLSYHLLSPQNEMIRFENQRFPLPQEVKPGKKRQTNISLRSPLEDGQYKLEFDLLVEGKFWFKDLGSSTASIELIVEPWHWAGGENEPELESGKYTEIRSSVEEIDQIFELIRITLEKNKVEFNGKNGKIYGFSPGSDYPQVWLRDANTIIPASRYFYAREYLVSWLEEHLYFQKSDGSLEDWFDSEGNTDKNTTETDQEAGAVQAAYQVYQLLGKKWLTKEINGKTIIERLDSALDYVAHHRMDSNYGLLIGAHTADWGDVDIVDSDEQAVYTDDRTHWTSDIYDQSMFFQACRELSEMLGELGMMQRAEKWLQAAGSIQAATDNLLWDEDKGFYRVHIHLDSLKHDFDENNIFALGGNTLAILSGLAGQDKTPRIINTALNRQNAFGVSTLSGTLLPPYPENTFKHPLLDEPFEYQNGAQWDWLGARLVYAMFENGLSGQAKLKLIEIIQKNLLNLGFFEWDDLQGTGHGSDYFAGSAGMMSRAVFEGYFGVKAGKNFLRLEPRLGEDNARIHLYFPCNDMWVAYEYSFDPDQKKITFKYHSNFSGKGIIKILLPGKASRPAITLDGKRIDYHLTTLNQDTYISFTSDFNHRTAEISF
ncbi:MAG: hypothetical protein JW755_13270 [Candidatus Aminicenantes bacterium]|nr:hypothetical protein [Candidatus Aminicenantes bacterium]